MGAGFDTGQTGGLMDVENDGPAAQADSDEWDTEPIRVLPAPTASVGTPAAALPRLQPPAARTQGPRRGPAAVVAVAAVIAVLAAVGYVVLRPAGEDDQPAAEPAPEPPSRGQPLLEMVSGHHPSGSCTAGEEAEEVVVTCTEDGIDVPTSATYRQATSPDELAAEFDRAVKDLDVVVCPGRIQSPGPWRRTGATSPAGTVVCGTRGEIPTVAWTTDEHNLLSVISTDPSRRALDVLYTWWSRNS